MSFCLLPPPDLYFKYNFCQTFNDIEFILPILRYHNGNNPCNYSEQSLDCVSESQLWFESLRTFLQCAHPVNCPLYKDGALFAI